MRKLKLDLDALIVTSFDAETAPEHAGGTVNARMADTTVCPQGTKQWSCSPTHCIDDTECCEYTWHNSCLPNNPCDTLHCVTGGETGCA